MYNDVIDRERGEVCFDCVESTSEVFECYDCGYYELRAFGVIHAGNVDIPCQIFYEDEPFFDTRPEDEREPELYMTGVYLEDGTYLSTV